MDDSKDVYNSKFAWLLGKINKALPYAITTSQYCSRYSCDKATVDSDPRWRIHEDTHKQQYADLGWFNFVYQYLLDSIKNGYTNNKFEVAAREAAAAAVIPPAV